MVSVPVRFVTSAVVLATIVAAAVQPSSAAPLSQSEARVLCVNINGGATGAPCSNADAYTTIQAAVDAAQSGDEIRIAKGMYTAYTADSDGSVISIIDKSLKFIGGFDSNNWTKHGMPNDTVIDGQNANRGITVQGGNIELAHLTITHGRAKNVNNAAAARGGAIYSVIGRLLLDNVTISDSEASEEGGGIYADEVVLTDAQVVNNRVAKFGGGVSASILRMHRSTIANNTAGGTDSPYTHGGGVFSGELEAVDSVITHNTAMYGGGVLAGDALIERTRIEHNSAELYGGGLWLDTSDGKIFNSMISNNTAGQHGGGLYAYNNVISIAGTVMSNNVAGIAGDAIYASDGLTSLRSVTIASTEPTPHEAVYAASPQSLFVFDTIITNHAVGVARGGDSWLGGDNNAFFGNGVDQTVDGAPQPLPFANFVTADPQFVNPAAGDFHLQPTSPLIDAGDPKREEPNPEWINARDIDGELVPWGGRADIGADEVVGTPRVLVPLVAR